jgi:sirohydrochlorin ferrochelatase
MQGKAWSMVQQDLQARWRDLATASSSTGVLLIGHGTRSPVGRRQCIALAELLRQHLSEHGASRWPLELAFLELAEPGIPEALGRLLARQVDRLIVFPLLLFAAGHARDDIPQAVRQALVKHGATDLPWVQAAPLGCHPAMLELSARQCQDAPGGAWGQPGDCLLLVGRGTSDRAAQADFLDFVAQRRAAAQPAPVEAAFLAQAHPTLDTQLQHLAASGFSRIVVQPHLLFAGELMESVSRQVAAAFDQREQPRWVVLPPLAEGVLRDPRQRALWIEAVLARLQEVAIRVVALPGQR